MNDFVTNVNLNLIAGATGNRLAWGDVTFFDRVKVNISIISSARGEAFVSWPSYKNGEGKFINNVRFAELDDFKAANEAILQTFNNLIGNSSDEPAAPEEVIEPKQEVVSVSPSKRPSVWAKVPKK